MFHCGAYNLVPRGTQMPYSAAVDLVAGLGYRSDTKELHVPCKMDTCIIVVTTPRALRSLVLYSMLWRDSCDGRLSKHYAQVDCQRKLVKFSRPSISILVFQGKRTKRKNPFSSGMKLGSCMERMSRVPNIFTQQT
ncbi:hypothetical protein M9H77_02130 [Catharanthus roseus]|uniref:Uncharacterized protein n=1 Tax=Catharanthus roseus TaxID=4058 RepID=A0ACC0C7G1_CATRO|nr:hypothetical protein M9H77_02130 [Catharanthus roseus]